MSETETENVTVEKAVRVLVGLQAGRIVNYVMRNFKVRPMVILEPFDGNGAVNGLLFFDGLNDNGNFPNPRRIGDSGQCSQTAEWIEGAEFREPFDDGGELTPGTWHWPVAARVRASSVDANAIETIVEQLVAKVREELLGNQEQLILTINEKLNATVSKVDDMLDSHSQLVQRAANLSGIVIGGTPGELEKSAASGNTCGNGSATGGTALVPIAESATNSAESGS